MPLTVAYIVLWLPEPSQTFVLDEVNTLWELGLPVQVYTLYGPRPARRLAGLAPVRAAVHHLGSRALPRLLGSLRRLPTEFGPEAVRFLAKVSCRRWRSLETAGEALWAAVAGVHLAGLFRRQGVQHIHASWANGPATAAWVAATLAGIPFSFCGRAHDIYPPDGALQEKILAAAFVRTENEANRRYLADLVPAAADKFLTIYNGVPLAGDRIVRPAPGPPFVILALGRFVVKKGFHVLLAACRLLQERGLEFRLVLAGDGPERQRLEGLIQSYGLQDRVALPGFVGHGEVHRLLAAAHLFVMPSIVAPGGDRDGTPTVIAEALQHEVPVVATAVCGIPEMVRPGVTGWLVPPSDPPALATAMAQALADPAAARRRAQRGRVLMASRFASRENYGRLRALFQAAIQGGEPALRQELSQQRKDFLVAAEPA